MNSDPNNRARVAKLYFRPRTKKDKPSTKRHEVTWCLRVPHKPAPWRVPICRIPNAVTELDDTWQERLSQLVEERYANIREELAAQASPKAKAWLERHPTQVVVDLKDAVAKWRRIQGRLRGAATPTGPARSDSLVNANTDSLSKLQALRQVYGEEDLVQLDSDHDRIAYEKVVFDRCAKVCARVIRRVTTSRQDAEDLIVEAFCRFWNRLSETVFHDASHMEAYLATVAKTCAVDHRRRKSHRIKTTELKPFMADRLREASLEDAAQAPDAMDQVSRVIDLYLSERERMVLRRFLEGQTALEIADSLPISAATVRSIKHRATSRIRSILVFNGEA